MSARITLLLVPLLALALTTILTPLVRAAAIRSVGALEARDDRWHRRPTPVFGGVAIFLGFAAALGALLWILPGEAAGLLHARGGAFLGLSPLAGVLAAATLVFAVGLVDDLRSLSPLVKLAGELAAAALLVSTGVGVWLTGVYWADVALSLVWFVGITNALNLLDNMDGVAGGVALVAALYLALLFLLEGEAGWMGVSLALAGALGGFLVHNYPPARIFMGDSGALFLGLLLAGLALAPVPGLSRSLAAVLAVPVLLLAVPILDTTLVTVGRMLEGRAVHVGGRDHTAHRLVTLGLSEERVLWVLVGLAAAGGAIGVVLRTVERAYATLLGGVLLVLLALLGAYLLSLRGRWAEEHRAAKAAATGEGAGEGIPLGARLLALHDRYPILTFLLDVLLAGLAYYAAYVIRWDAPRLAVELDYFRASLPALVAAKAAAFVLAGMYLPRWRHFGLHDGVRILQANFVASLLAGGLLFLVARTGLSRGVMVVDFLVCTLLTGGVRLSFRLLEGTTRRWSTAGTPAVLCCALDDARVAMDELARTEGPGLRTVAVADPGSRRDRGRFHGLPVFGGEDALVRALEATRAPAVAVVSRGGEELPDGLREHLARRGSVDVWRIRVGVERVEG